MAPSGSPSAGSRTTAGSSPGSGTSRSSPSTGIPIRNIQTNLSYNRRRGTIRGLHWQVEPYGESKLIRCTRGSVFDVAVDLRAGSSTYGRWQGVTPRPRRSANLVFVPAGCAHGYQALEDDAEVSYQVSHAYVPGSERGIRWNDPAIGIEWPISDDVIVSEKDARLAGRRTRGAHRERPAAGDRGAPRRRRSDPSRARRGRFRGPRLRRSGSSSGVPGIRLVAVANRTIEEAERAYRDAGRGRRRPCLDRGRARRGHRGRSAGRH